MVPQIQFDAVWSELLTASLNKPQISDEYDFIYFAASLYMLLHIRKENQCLIPNAERKIYKNV
jgi:hypothetical protein